MIWRHTSTSSARGTGAQADWYHNICAEPVAAIRVGNRERVPAQRLLDVEEAASRFKTYEARSMVSPRR